MRRSFSPNQSPRRSLERRPSLLKDYSDRSINLTEQEDLSRLPLRKYPKDNGRATSSYLPSSLQRGGPSVSAFSEGEDKIEFLFRPLHTNPSGIPMKLQRSLSARLTAPKKQLAAPLTPTPSSKTSRRLSSRSLNSRSFDLLVPPAAKSTDIRDFESSFHSTGSTCMSVEQKQEEDRALLVNQISTFQKSPTKRNRRKSQFPKSQTAAKSELVISIPKTIQTEMENSSIGRKKSVRRVQPPTEKTPPKAKPVFALTNDLNKSKNTSTSEESPSEPSSPRSEVPRPHLRHSSSTVTQASDVALVDGTVGDHHHHNDDVVWTRGFRPRNRRDLASAIQCGSAFAPNHPANLFNASRITRHDYSHSSSEATAPAAASPRGRQLSSLLKKTVDAANDTTNVPASRARRSTEMAHAGSPRSMKTNSNSGRRASLTSRDMTALLMIKSNSTRVLNCK